MPFLKRNGRRPDGSPGSGRQTFPALVMIVPAVAVLAVFQFLPLFYALFDSFREFSPFSPEAVGWAGLANYTTVLDDPVFRRAFLNTLLYIVLMLVVTIPLALFLAVLLDRKFFGEVFARGAIVAALAMSETVAALIWIEMYAPRNGLFNAVLSAIGLPEQPFLISDTQALISITVMMAWKDVGLPMLLFLAGLQNIPRELYEAAELDGASEWQTFSQITLPLLKPTMVVALFMTTITAARIFTPIIIMTQGGPDGASSNLTYYSYQQNFEYMAPGPATASVVFIICILALITAVQVRMIRSPKGAQQ